MVLPCCPPLVLVRCQHRLDVQGLVVPSLVLVRNLHSNRWGGVKLPSLRGHWLKFFSVDSTEVAVLLRAPGTPTRGERNLKSELQNAVQKCEGLACSSKKRNGISCLWVPAWPLGLQEWLSGQ